MRQDHELRLTPFILLTDDTARSHIRQAMELGADDCIVRPVSHPEIGNTIAARIRRQTATSELYLTTLRNTAEQINRLAHYDALTDLPNYRLLHQRLSQAITIAHSSQQTLAFMSVSLDRLRLVNTVMGYPAGDELLKASARRMQACLPPEATLARLTANQFAVVLPNLPRPQQARETAENLMDALSRPFSLPGQEIFVTTSIGVAFFAASKRRYLHAATTGRCGARICQKSKRVTTVSSIGLICQSLLATKFRWRLGCATR